MKDLFAPQSSIALVTGGSRGIGRMIARGFLEYGAKVYISSRKAQACESTAAALRGQGGECIAIPQDVSTVEGCRSLAGEIERRAGGIPCTALSTASRTSP